MVAELQEVHWRVEGKTMYRTADGFEAIRRCQEFLRALDGISSIPVTIEIFGSEKV